MHPRATGMIVDPDMAEALVEDLEGFRLDAGLTIRRAKIVHFGGSPILAIRYSDSKHTEMVLGAWWDFHDYEDYLHDPSEAAWLAGHAKVWLEEVFHTVPLKDFTEDDHGVRWAMLDYPSRDDVGRLPPHRAPG